MTEQDITIIKRPIAELIEAEYNPRKITDKQFSQLKDSLKRFGFVDPVLVNMHPDRTNIIIGGHMRTKAAEALGYTDVPCVELNLTLEQEKELNIRLNKSGGTFDFDMLANYFETEELLEWGFEDFEFGVEEVTELPPAEEGEVNLDPPKEPITVLGDLYELNGHRVLCGSSTDVQVLEHLCNGTIPDLVFTDPPYGVAIVSKKSKSVGGGGETKFKGTVGGGKVVAATEYREIIGDETTETAQEFYHACVALGMENFIIWGGNYFTDFLAPSPCWVIWDKQNTGNFADVEMAWASFDKGAKLYSWLWNGMSRKGDHITELAKRVHPTQKPVGLFIDIFKDFDFKICFDGFLGSGSTLIAAEAVNRLCYATELDNGYVDTEVRRWVKYMQDNNRPYTVKRNGEQLTEAQIQEYFNG